MFGRKRDRMPTEDVMGRMPGWYDAMEGRYDSLKVALDAGLDKDHMDKEGMSLLFVAAHYGHIECVKLLLESGADPNIVNRHGNGPLWEATREASQNGNPAREPYDLDNVRLLLSFGADPSHLNNAGRAPAGWASLSEELRTLYRGAGYEGEFEL